MLLSEQMLLPEQMLLQSLLLQARMVFLITGYNDDSIS